MQNLYGAVECSTKVKNIIRRPSQSLYILCPDYLVARPSDNVFYGSAPCDLTDVSEEYTCLQGHEDRETMFYRNSGIYLQVQTVLQPNENRRRITWHRIWRQQNLFFIAALVQSEPTKNLTDFRILKHVNRSWRDVLRNSYIQNRGKYIFLF